jgi:hypothetical protein
VLRYVREGKLTRKAIARIHGITLDCLNTIVKRHGRDQITR